MVSLKQTVLLSVNWCTGVKACIFLALVCSPGYHVLYCEANIELYSDSFATSTCWYVNYNTWSNILYTTTCAVFTTVTLTSSADSVCPGDTVVFTCVTDTAPLVWSTSVNEVVKVYHSPDQVNQPAVNIGGILTVKLVNTTGRFESTATAHNVSLDYNGVNVTCSESIDKTYSNINSITIAIGERYISNYTYIVLRVHVHKLYC